MEQVSPQFVIEGLMRRGYPAHVAQGFVMNMMDESGLRPGINEAAPIVPGSRGGFGLYQLTGPRRTAYEQFAAQRGVNPADAEAQLDFLDYEMKGPESRAAKSILSTRNPQEAAVAIARDFLRPASQHLQSRVARYTGADVAADTMAALGKGGGAVTPDQIAQSAQAQSTGMQEEQQPRGLLGGLFSNPDLMANLAIAFNSMRLNPDPNLPQVLSAQMKERRGQRQATAQKNRTLDYLRSLGTPQAMEAIRYAEGTGDIAGALKMATAAGKDDRTALIKNFEFAKSQGFEGSLQDFMKAGGGGGTVVNVGGEGVKLTPFQKKRDEAFAEKMIDWSSTGAVDSSRQVAQISSVMKQFEAGKPLTGPLFAALDAVGLSSIFSPEAKQAKDTVEQVVQRSLRETLGGQFAEREGERLIQRAYNPALPPEANLARLKGLFEQLSFADQAKRAMIEYANKNGTLVGYEGPEMPTASQIEAAMDSAYKPDEVKTPQSGGGGLPVVKSDKDFDLLPSGAEFVDENGKRYRKP